MADNSLLKPDQATVVGNHETVGGADRVFMSNTLKRNPKMEMSKQELLQLLSCLEGELQARDIAIASLKMEQVKQMLSRAKYGWSDVSDPVVALQHDSDKVKDSENEDAAIRGIYGNQLMQLERLINTQRVAQQQMRDQLIAVEKQYHRTCAELEEIKRKHAGEIELAENVTCLLEKDRDRYKQEAELHQARCKQMEVDLRTVKENQSEGQNVVAKHRQVALMLLRERSRLVMKLLETRERCSELEQKLKDECEKSSSLEENLERQVAECEQLCSRLASAESLNRTLQLELDGLRSASAAVQVVCVETVDVGRQVQSQLPTRSVTVLENRSTGKTSPRIQTETSVKTVKNSAPVARSDSTNTSSSERWAVPMNRNIAAARLRTVLSAAIEGTTGSSVSETGATRLSTAGSQQNLPSTFQPSPANSPRSLSQISLTASKLPQVTASGQSSTFAGGHSAQRSVVLPPAGNSNPVQPVSENRSFGRLTPLVPISPRLAPLVPSGQTNGSTAATVAAGGNFALKPVNSSSK